MQLLGILKGAAIGAGFMYLFDPSQGRRRRALIRDKAVHAWNEAGDTIESKSRDIANRAQGAIHNAATIVSPDRIRRSGASMVSMPGWMPATWSPQTRLLVTAAAGILALYGKRRGDMLGTALGALSVGIITNSISAHELRHGIEAAPSLPSDYSGAADEDFPTHRGTMSEHRPRAAKSM